MLNGEECKELYGKALLQAVKESIRAFSGKAEQADDITMTSMAFLDYKTIEKQEGNLWKFETAAVMEKLDLVLDFTQRMMKQKKAPQQEIMKLQFVIDELFSKEESIVIFIEDRGILYNPLERENPDIELAPENREIGGLGVFLVKNMVEHMEYQRKNGRNRVELVISWGG